MDVVVVVVVVPLESPFSVVVRLPNKLYGYTNHIYFKQASFYILCSPDPSAPVPVYMVMVKSTEQHAVASNPPSFPELSVLNSSVTFPPVLVKGPGM